MREWIARSRIEIEQLRLLVLKSAWLMDTLGNAAARTEVAAIKVAALDVAHKVVDRAVQAHGAAGVSDDTVLARLFAITRALRIADGPDEVHLRTIARRELAQYRKTDTKAGQREHHGLEGQVAVITGGSRGIGLGIATAYRAAGAHVVIAARKAAGLAEAREELLRAGGDGDVHAVVANAGRTRAGASLRRGDHGPLRPRRHPRQQRGHQPVPRRPARPGPAAGGEDRRASTSTACSPGPAAPGGPGWPSTAARWSTSPRSAG